MTTSKPSTAEHAAPIVRNPGYGFALAAFGIWGLIPIYFKVLEHVDALEILAHRIAWSVPVVVLFILVLRKSFQTKELFGNPRNLLFLLASALLVSCNWGVFTWAATNGRVLETSLGYFINPLVSMLLGAVFLKERMGKWLLIAVGLAFTGVLIRVIVLGSLPWVSLSLATTFGIYGLIRKQVEIEALPGLLVETLFVLPITLGYLWFIHTSNQAAFLHVDASTDWLLIAGGIVTTVPLALFAAAARKLPLYSLGFIQFLAPSISFMLAVFAFKEPFSGGQLIAFVFIWIGLAVYTWDLLRQQHRQRGERKSLGRSEKKEAS